MLAFLKFQKICVFKISNAYEIFMPLKLNILTALKILNLKLGIKIYAFKF